MLSILEKKKKVCLAFICDLCVLFWICQRGSPYFFGVVLIFLDFLYMFILYHFILSSNKIDQIDRFILISCTLAKKTLLDEFGLQISFGSKSSFNNSFLDKNIIFCKHNQTS